MGFHDIAFLPSAEKQALADVSALAGASRLLVRIHGSFMLAAWIGTASIGILLARYYRQTWVDRSLCGKDLWFAVCPEKEFQIHFLKNFNIDFSGIECL